MLFVDEITWKHSVLTDACDQVHYEIWLNSVKKWQSADFVVGYNGSLDDVITPVPHVLGDNLILHARDVEEDTHRFRVNGTIVDVPIIPGGNDVIIDQVVPLIPTNPDVVTIPPTIIPWGRAKASPELLWNLHYWLFTNNPDTGENKLRPDQLDYWLGVLQRTGATGIVVMFGYDYYSRGRWNDACHDIAEILDFFRLNGFDTYISMGVHTIDEQSIVEAGSYVHAVETFIELFGDRIRGILLDVAWTGTVPTWQELDDWFVAKGIHLRNLKYDAGYYHGDDAIACGGATECIPDVSMVDPMKMEVVPMIHWGFNYDDETWRARRWDFQREWSHYTLNTLFEHPNRYDNPTTPYPSAEWTIWEWYEYRKARLDDARFKALVFGCYRFEMKPTPPMEADIKKARDAFFSTHAPNLTVPIILASLLALGIGGFVAYEAFK